MNFDYAMLIDRTGQPVAGAPLGALLTAHAVVTPEAPAITAQGVTLSFAELDRAANRRARWLAARGVTPESVVLLALPNSPEYYECAFAVWKLGATPGHVSYRLSPLEFAAILELAQPALVLGDGVLPGTIHSAPVDISISAEPLAPAAAAVSKLSTSGGSTGRPKLIVDSNAAVWGPDKEGRMRKPRSIIINPAPLYHSAPFGLMLPAMAQGSHIIEAGSFDPEGYVALLARHRANWAYLVPTMMARIAHLSHAVLGQYDVSALETVVHMAASCPVWVKRFWIEWLGPEKIWEVYGGTERIGATIIGGTEWLEHPGSVGRAPTGSEIGIFGDADVMLPAGTVGEIYFRAETTNTGFRYIGAEARRRGEWTSFGDLGWLDEKGYLFIADRRTDMIVSGGVNFYPAEIEAAIDAYPGVLSSVVIGLPDADLGQVLHAIVQVAVNDLNRIQEMDLRQFLISQLAKPKHPRGFDFITEAVRDAAGKVRRAAWRERWIATPPRHSHANNLGTEQHA